MILIFVIVQEYPSKDIVESVSLFPNQALLCSDFITNTAKIEAAITTCEDKGNFLYVFLNLFIINIILLILYCD